jgi:hypothetical protein
MVLVDWAGAGRGPRAWSLAFLLYPEGAAGLPGLKTLAEAIAARARAALAR